MQRVSRISVALFSLLIAFSSDAFAKRNSQKNSSKRKNPEESHSVETPAKKSSQKKRQLEEPHTINFHDNCPRITEALQEEVALKATIPGYKGIMTVTYTVWPEEKYVYPLTEFYGCCNRIRQAVEKSRGKKCILAFCTSPDGNGVLMDISSEKNALETATYLVENRIENLHALYLDEEQFNSLNEKSSEGDATADGQMVTVTDSIPD